MDRHRQWLGSQVERAGWRRTLGEDEEPDEVEHRRGSDGVLRAARQIAVSVSHVLS